MSSAPALLSFMLTLWHGWKPCPFKAAMLRVTKRVSYLLGGKGRFLDYVPASLREAGTSLGMTK